MKRLYTDIDNKVCAWVERLVESGALPKGDVWCRDMASIDPDEVAGYQERHWCCGIGGWALALKIAGWPQGVPVDTASLPCQPFSIAGKQKGEKDERHIWPEFFRIVRKSRPGVIFGEQVPAAIGLGWLDGIFDDLEGEGYACGAIVLPACSVGAPHIRQRLWWVAHSINDGRRARSAPNDPSQESADIGYAGDAGGMADAERHAFESRRTTDQSRESAGEAQTGTPVEFRRCGMSGGLDDSKSIGQRAQQGSERRREGENAGSRDGAGGSSPWDAYDLIPCADGKARRIESGTFPLAHGVPGRVGLLRGYGNAIVPQVAAMFVSCWTNGQNTW